jgi:hypothetical protein
LETEVFMAVLESAIVATERAGIKSPARSSFSYPLIRRDGIFWTEGAEGRSLQLSLTFHNPGSRPTVPAVARVQVAEFGAFLPWKPLTRVAVPSVPPGGRRVVTATAADDALPPSPTKVPILEGTGVAVRPFLRRSSILHWLTEARDAHFVGNLNVFVTRRAPVERHFHRAVGLMPDRNNMAMFLVGDGRRDHYTFSGKTEPGWEVEMPDVPWGQPVAITRDSLLLRIRPPARAESGRVSICVHRQSTAETVPIEFELEARASGAKCYFF